MKYDDDESGEERYYVEWRGRHVCCGMVGGWGGVKRREEKRGEGMGCVERT